MSLERKIRFKNVDHIGVIVRDIGLAVEHYESLGFGPFVSPGRIERISMKVLGEPVDPDSIHLWIKKSNTQQVAIELIEPGRNSYLWGDFLRTRGEGVNHICYLVDDIVKEQAELLGKGAKVLVESRYKGGGGATYFDAGQIGGFLIELMQIPIV